MKFEARYYKDRLAMINPKGDVGVVTLWSKVESSIKVIREAGIDLLPESSRVAVVANLYGNGLPQILRNLLWNPQIRYLLVLGKDLSGSWQELLNFFSLGLEEFEFLGSKSFRIFGTNRVMDGLIKPQDFEGLSQVAFLGSLTAAKKKVGPFFENLPAVGREELERKEPPPIPESEISRFPSEARSHTIVSQTPLDAWAELVFRLIRFGHRNTVSKKTGQEERVELLNTHVVVVKPQKESGESLSAFGFSLEELEDYQGHFLDPVKPPDLDYTYGNRLRGHFSFKGETVDSPIIVAERLRQAPDSRHCFISLWDNNRDLPEGKGCPCFVSAFFRKFEGKLNLTAIFRTHNAMDAWLKNFYGLMALQKFVAERCEMEIGPITVFSQSVSISPDSLGKAEVIASNKKVSSKVRFDPSGDFRVTVDPESREIVAEHFFAGAKIGEYRGKTAEALEKQLTRDCALSDISHALYLGRELARKEMQLKNTGPAAS